MTNDQEYVTLYTAQAPIVLDTLESDGMYRVKMEYVDKKYGDQAWIFKQAYSYFARYAPQYLPRPEGAESGVWLFKDERWVASAPGCWMLKLSVPKDQAIFFDLRIWNKMLNLEYVGSSSAEEDAYNRRLEQMGITDTVKVFNTSFFPLVKREIQESWKRLFTSAAECPNNYLQAGVWELKKEWIVAKKIL